MHELKSQLKQGFQLTFSQSTNLTGILNSNQEIGAIFLVTEVFGHELCFLSDLSILKSDSSVIV